MNKPVKPEALRVLPPGLTGRLKTHVESGKFESVSEAVFVAASAFADQLEFNTRDDVEAIRRSIEASIASDDYVDAETVFADLRSRYGVAED